MSSNPETTVDSKEVAFFGKKTGEEWWDPCKTRVLHAMNNVRIPFVKNGLIKNGAVSTETAQTETPLKGLQILDVGCAVGIVAEPFALMGASVTGLDPSSELISVAKSHAALNPNTKAIRYIEGTIEDHVKDHANFYDAVVASEVIEHVVNPELFLKSCVAAVKPGGSIFVTTPNQTYVSWLYGIVILEHVLNIIPKGTHDYDKFISSARLQQLLEEENCRTVKISGSYYNALTNGFYSSSYTGIYYCLHAVKSTS